MIYLYSESEMVMQLHAWNRCLFVPSFVCCMPVSEFGWVLNKMDVVFHLLFKEKRIRLKDVEYFRTVKQSLD